MGEVDRRSRVPASPIDLLDPSRCFARPPKTEGPVAKRKRVAPPKTAEGADSKCKRGAEETQPLKVLPALPKPTSGGECPTPPTVTAAGEGPSHGQHAGAAGGAPVRSAAAAAWVAAGQVTTRV